MIKLESGLADGFRFLRTLTPCRIANIAGVYLGYLGSVITRNVLLWGKPYSLSIEPTNHCNLNCPECPSGCGQLARARGFMNIRLYQKILDETADHLIWLMLYFQGEPFLHQDIGAMVRYAKEKNIYTCISTNGHFLTPENCRKIISAGTDRIIVSLDGADQGTYAKYRINGSLQKVKVGIEHLSREKYKLRAKNPLIVIQTLVFKHNQHQLDEIKKMANHLGADRISFKSAQIYNYSNKSALIPDFRKYSRYRKNADGRLYLKNKLKNRCFRIWNSCVVTFDGHMLPCCFDKKGEYPLSNLAEQNFEAGWKSRNFRAFRKKILINRKTMHICRNCTAG
ncbi:MAG: radical SAM/SPASM domain-containing protein [Bacteroidota bacterium]